MRRRVSRGRRGEAEERGKKGWSRRKERKKEKRKRKKIRGEARNNKG